MNRGKLVVIDGLDGCGKATQTEMLKEYFHTYTNPYGCNFTTIDFPRYGKPSCSMVELYLKGEFGKDPNSINPYTGSMFYASDRSISFITEEWGKVYKNGGLVIADRYTCSNVIHQGSKMIEKYESVEEFARSDEFRSYINWLYTTEYDSSGIPRPDVIIYLYQSKEANDKMLHKRRAANDNPTDIHETNEKYLNNCRLALEAYRMLVEVNSNTLTKIAPSEVKHLIFPEIVTYPDLNQIHHHFIRVDNLDYDPLDKDIIHNKILDCLRKENII